MARLGADLRSTLRPLNLSAAIKDKEFNPILVETSDSVKVVNESTRKVGNHSRLAYTAMELTRFSGLYSHLLSSRL